MLIIIIIIIISKSRSLTCLHHQSEAEAGPHLRPLPAQGRLCRHPAAGRGVPPVGHRLQNRKHNTTENHLYHPQHWCIHIRSEMYNNILKISTGYIYLCVLGRLIILKWIQISTDLLCLLKRCWRLFAAGPSPTYSEASQEDPCPIASSACRPSAPLTHLEEQNYIWYVLIQHQTCPNL